MKIAIISTGDELLEGYTADTNAAWMAARFREEGFKVRHFEVVGDDVEEISSVLRHAMALNDLVVVGGGLGPTDDDVTAAAAARAIGVPVVRSAAAEELVLASFARLGFGMDPINLRQADLPEGCRVLPNPWGTAPGFAIGFGDCAACFLPGVPAELRPMFDRHVVPGLPRPETTAAPIALRCFGAGESSLQAALGPLLQSRLGLRAAFRVSFPEVGVTISGFDPSLRDSIREEALSLVGYAVFAEGQADLPTALGRALLAGETTIGCAESCTGGLIGHAMTSVAGSSAWFRGGVVAYSNDLKTSLLAVPAELIEAHGAVSEATVRAMAVGARERLGCDLALATSGIAGPGGGGPDKPVGLVHLALAHAGGTEHARRVFTGYERGHVKRAAAWTAMKLALDFVEGAGPGGAKSP